MPSSIIVFFVRLFFKPRMVKSVDNIYWGSLFQESFLKPFPLFKPHNFPGKYLVKFPFSPHVEIKAQMLSNIYFLFRFFCQHSLFSESAFLNELRNTGCYLALGWGLCMGWPCTEQLASLAHEHKKPVATPNGSPYISQTCLRRTTTPWIGTPALKDSLSIRTKN